LYIPTYETQLRPKTKQSGATFTLGLPASEAQSVDLKTKQGEVVEDSIIEQTTRILVMDDEEMICKFLTEILEGYGLSVSIALDGKQAIEIYKQSLVEGNPFDAIILDLTIPEGMGGKEAVKELLKIDPKVKCIVSSGYSNDPVMANYDEYGFKANMTKPYFPNKLLEVLSQVLKE